MRAEREDNVHIFVFDAELIHLVDENRHKVEAVCDACRVIADEGNLLARFDDFVDRRTSDRVVDRLKNFVGDVFHRLEFFGTNFFQNQSFVELDFFRALSIGQNVLLHGVS